MTERQYFQLCNACDDLLLGKDSSIERVSIPSLHVLREHPIFLKRYNLLFQNKKESFHVKLIRKSQLYAKRLIGVFSSRSNWTVSSSINNNVDIVFVSHLLNNEQAGAKKDFYFSDIPNRLEKSGYSIVVVLINHTKLLPKSASQQWNETDIPRVVLSNNLPIHVERKLKARLKLEAKKIKSLQFNDNSSFRKKLINQVAEDALSNETFLTNKLSYQFQEVINTFNPKVLVTTFEGHSWERVFFASARKVNEQIKCVAYQHAAIFRLQHAIRRNLHLHYNPDYILTAGLVGKQQLMIDERLATIPIDILGSDRGKREVDGFNEGEKSACLVLPEGMIDECITLFNFSIQCAKLHPDIDFIWRLHPIISFKDLKRSGFKFQNLPNNIIISKNRFEDDLVISKFAIYRGTTSIIKAVLSDTIPVYLKLEDEMTIDPLYSIEEGKFILSQPSEFRRIIDDLNPHSDGFRINFLKLKSYCKTFYMDFNPEALLRIVNSTFCS